MGLLSNVWDSVGGTLVGLGYSYLQSQLSQLLRIDYPMTCNFAVEIDGIGDAGFATCQGLHDRLTPYEITEVNSTISTQIDTNTRQIGLVTLEQGFMFQGSIENWYYDVAGYQKGNPSPLKNISIIQLQRIAKGVPLLGNQLVEVRRWNLYDCSCVDLTFPQFDASEEAQISMLKFVIRAKTYDRPTTFGSWGLVLDLVKG